MYDDSKMHSTSITGSAFAFSGLFCYAACAVLPSSTVRSADLSHAASAIETLQQHWYDNDTGLWDNQWWNSANVLTMLADFNACDPALNETIRGVFNNTYIQAQANPPFVVKIWTPWWTDSYTSSSYPFSAQKPLGTLSNASKGFTNYFYDDEGWWALAWLKVYDITQEERYLQSAIDLFEDMTGGYNATCGGIWWDKGHQHNTAIANELFLAVAARLAVTLPHQEYYRHWALKQWNWFRRSGMIKADYTINDGLNLETCKADHGAIWTYTHGVILGALIDLDLLSPNQTYLATARRIAFAAIHYFKDSNGILREPCEPNCGADGPQFKGIFLRNLQRLQDTKSDPAFKRFIERNAHAIWTLDRDSDNKLGLVWAGPYMNATASTHSSACDALVAAAAMGGTGYSRTSAIEG